MHHLGDEDLSPLSICIKPSMKLWPVVKPCSTHSAHSMNYYEDFVNIFHLVDCESMLCVIYSIIFWNIVWRVCKDRK